MASPLSAVFCALVGTAFWTVLGYAIARHLLPRPLAFGAAPVIGWAAFSAATLPLLNLIGFSSPAPVLLAALCLALAVASLLRPSAPFEAEIGVKPWPFTAAGMLALLLALLLALAPAIALLPKDSGTGVHLADPIFDHSKIAIIDAMTRQGLPPVNPIFGEGGAAGRLVYYYLWHFSAAELALPLHLSGWEADIGLTWLTAFASLTLMMGIAVWLSKKAAAAILVVALAAGASLREVLSFVFGNYTLEPFLKEPTGFAGWLFQSVWVPQHLMAASCAIAAMLLLVEAVQRPTLLRLVTLVLVMVAGFESSTFVGGVTFAVAASVAAPFLFAAIEKERRLAVAASLAAAAIVAIVFAAAFIRDQFGIVAARGQGSSPIVLHHFEVLGEMFPQSLRRVLDLPAYWLILLPLEFPAVFIAGVIALIAMLGSAKAAAEKIAVKVFVVLAVTGLSISWLLASTLGDNNDLGLRAVLPAAMILIASAAAGMLVVPSRTWRVVIATAAFAGLILSLPDTAAMIYSNLRGTPAADAAVFTQTPELWSAVRRHAGVNARVANNPLFLADLTPWPANISWALLADRSSCFAGRELAIPFAPLPPQRREAINSQFIRVFAGKPMLGDVGEFAATYGCDVVVVTPQDGAWSSDPFATSGDYHLAESREDRWRIYVRAR
jgi:hypothetical protein